MSLEAALAENTAVMKQLITVMQSATHGTPAKTEKGKPAATPTAAPDATRAAVPTPVAFGDPAGTRYFVVEAHNTVFSVKPGDVEPTVAGAVEVHVDAYLAKKDEFAKKIKAAGAAASAPAPTAAPATGEPSATPQVVTASAAQPQATEPSFQEVVAKLQALHKLGGNDALKRVLDKHGAAKVPDLNGKAANSVLIADTEAVTKDVNEAKALGL